MATAAKLLARMRANPRGDYTIEQFKTIAERFGIDYLQPGYLVRLSALAAAEGGGWLAEAPDLPGCISDGETREEAMRNLDDAICSWIATAREFGDPVPPPGGADRYKWPVGDAGFENPTQTSRRAGGDRRRQPQRARLTTSRGRHRPVVAATALAGADGSPKTRDRA